MKMLTRIALLCCLFSIGIHLYLTLHYYPLQFASASGPSVCNLGGKFNCDAVSASTYSAISGIPVSIFGMVENFLLFVLILVAWIQWTENPEKIRRWALTLAGASLGASLVMGGISVFMLGNYCLFCMALYVLSFVIFMCVRGTLTENYLEGIKRDLPLMWAESQNILGAFFAIPILAYLIHQGFLQNFGAEQVERISTAAVAEWVTNPLKDISAKPLLSMGPERSKATLTLSEFADFRCHHCKNAVSSLHAFTKANSDVRFEYYAFPLDGDCNSGAQVKTGLSCYLAYAVHCAQAQEKGWEMHDAVYGAQEKINELQNVDELKTFMPELIKSVGVDSTALDKCIADPATMDAIRSQAKQGELIGVNGTPAIFGNQKLLNRGQAIPVLEAVHLKLIK